MDTVLQAQRHAGEAGCAPRHPPSPQPPPQLPPKPTPTPAPASTVPQCLPLPQVLKYDLASFIPKIDIEQGVHHMLTAHVWTGELTTVENQYYGVRPGQKVRAMIFSLDVPGERHRCTGRGTSPSIAPHTAPH